MAGKPDNRGRTDVHAHAERVAGIEIGFWLGRQNGAALDRAEAPCPTDSRTEAVWRLPSGRVLSAPFEALTEPVPVSASGDAR